MYDIQDFDVVILKDGRTGTVADAPKDQKTNLTVDFAKCEGDPENIKNWDWWYEDIPFNEVKKVIWRLGIGDVDIEIEG